ncbi:Photosystem II protein I [Caenorhabditis elegans]|uniref:Photosystem II protein I n=1 Tax=Caenorhabditis elegans TaxID=6239 RepID=H2L2J1_CAEEL|nr:Photosystem II protein I [Caenorhabditis elegans]CCE71573.1 Photosystem II protein I [Caenorhabditis elegans]|eukprot:NP_001255755.1 Uncharacterized protein CELE_T23G4.127 [Caenorhabditis elegans]
MTNMIYLLSLFSRIIIVYTLKSTAALPGRQSTANER